ncbi:hypothetical protein Tco_1412584 [Tanacetum coccineum]
MTISKDQVTRVPVWVKFHKVPVVAYSEDGLSLIATQVGTPIMLDAFTSDMFMETWGRVGYARALIEVEYEWKPPVCVDFKVFSHANHQCPKRIPTKVVPTEEIHDDGFTVVKNRKAKGKNVATIQRGNFNGVRINNKKRSSVEPEINSVKGKKTSDGSVDTQDRKEEDDVASWNVRGLNCAPKQSKVPQVVNENQLSVCAILEFHVDISTLAKNVDIVHVMVLAQSIKALHVKVIHKETNKIIFCSIIYAVNKQAQRRLLWRELGAHKNVVRGYPWTLMGDFNVALNMEDTHVGSSSMNSAMCEFKDCVFNIEFLDVTSSGLHYTWNQKPRGGDGVLKKLDRIMANLDLIDSFPGVHAIFQPYRILDHSPTVLKFPSLVASKPKPFKFYNFLAFKSKFMEIVNSHWNSDIEGYNIQCPKALDSSHDDPIFREEEGVYVQAFNEAKLDEERFLKQKDKVEWLDVGDSNSAYFHKTIKSKNQRSRMETILNSDNVEVLSSMVPEVFGKHYEQFLGSDMECTNLNVEGLFSKTIPSHIASNMVRNVTNKEIKDAMCDIGDEKAPGPDGFTSLFFKKGWDIIGDDICNVVQDFFSNGKLLKEINHTF